MATIYVIRTLGSILIIQGTQIISLPTTIVVARCRDGAVKATSH